MNTQHLGPIEIHDVNKIKDALRKVGVQAEVRIEDHDDGMGNNRQVAYIDVPENVIETLRPLMEKLGYWHGAAMPGEAELEGDDYMCPKCGYHADSLRMCPKHQVRLVPFPEWAAIEAARAERNRKIVSALIFAMAAAAALWWAR